MNWLKNSLFLYTITSLIWGSTWLVIVYQIENTSPLVSVFYRFLISGLILIGLKKFFSPVFKVSLHQMGFIALQGICMFSINYMLTYISESMIPSGLVAMAFTSLIYFNIAGGAFFFSHKISKRMLSGASLGFIGIALIFHKEIIEFQLSSQTSLGLIISLLATFAASMGNLSSVKLRQMNVPVIASTGYSMLIGAAFTFVVCLFRNESFSVPMTFQFWASLFYLSVFGSVIAFSAYLTLIQRIGAAQSGYVSIISPIIALALSSVFEGIHWNVWMYLGAVLAVLGNTLALSQRES